MAEEGIAIPAAEDYVALPGKGASARVAGREVVVGSSRLTHERGLASTDEQPSLLTQEMAWLAAEGATPLFVAAAESGEALRPLGVIAVADRLRPHAADAVRRMRESGIERRHPHRRHPRHGRGHRARSAPTASWRSSCPRRRPPPCAICADVTDRW